LRLVAMEKDKGLAGRTGRDETIERPMSGLADYAP
jgi:hypothetical protein